MGRKFGREMCGVLPFRSDKTDTLYPTMSAVPNLVGARGLLATAGRCCHNVLSLCSSRTSLPPEVLILFRSQKAKNQPVGWFF